MEKIRESTVLKILCYILIPIIALSLILSIAYIGLRDQYGNSNDIEASYLDSYDFSYEYMYSLIRNVNGIRNGHTDYENNGFYNKIDENIYYNENYTEYYSYNNFITFMKFVIVKNDTNEIFTNIQSNDYLNEVTNFKNNKIYWIYENGSIDTSITNLSHDKIRYLSLLYEGLDTFNGYNIYTYIAIGNMKYSNTIQLTSILLNMFFGPAINAARGISLQIEQTVRTFVVNFQSAINPQIIKYHAQKETMQMHLLMYRSSKFSLFLLAIFALPIMLETSTILNIWLGQVPDHTISFIRIMFIVIALETMSNSIMTGVVANGNIKNYQLVVSLILLSIIPISYISLRIGAVAETVFIVYLIVEIFAVAARLFFAQKMLFLDIKRFIYDVILRSIVVIVVGSIIPISLHIIMPEGYIRFMVVVISGFITSLYAIYKLGLNNHEQTMVKEAIRKKLQR